MRQPSFDPGLTQQYNRSLRRAINPDGSFNVLRRGTNWRDVHPYLHLINMSWPAFLGTLFVAYLIVNILNVLVVYVFCRIFFHFIRYELILKYLGILIGINILIVFSLKYLGMLMAHRSALLTVASGSIVYAGLLLCLNHFFHLNADFKLFLNNMRQKIIARKL